MTTTDGYHQLYRRRKRGELIEYLGGNNPACAKCGSTTSLEFDHIDPSTKSFNINARYWQGVDVLQDELDKCQLLCESCHLTKTRVERSKYFHGKPYAFEERGCVCDECLDAKRAWDALPDDQRRRKPIKLWLIRNPEALPKAKPPSEYTPPPSSSWWLDTFLESIPR